VREQRRFFHFDTFSSIMNSLSQNQVTYTDYLDLVETALSTLARRLPLHVSREDLASVGKLALIAALRNTQGSVNETRAYCYVRVRGAMLDELRRLDPLSRGHREKQTAVARAQSELSMRLGRAANPSELALATQLSLREVASAQARLETEWDLTNPGLESLTDAEALTPAETTETEDLRFELRAALSRLSSNQAAVLYRYYFDDATLETIAAELSVSKERVRQIREAGEKKLRADFVVLAIWQSLLDRE